MAEATLTTFSAKDAKARFGELLDEALGQPVAITRHDRLTAYLVSRRHYEAMLEKLQSLEDQLWLLKADAARTEGYAGRERVDAFLRDFDEGTHNNEKTAVHETGPGVRRST
jgi:prevent-host-death family protein